MLPIIGALGQVLGAIGASGAASALSGASQSVLGNAIQAPGALGGSDGILARILGKARPNLVRRQPPAVAGTQQPSPTDTVSAENDLMGKVQP